MKRFLFFKLCSAVLLASLCSSQVQAAVTLNSTNFPDANFRAALTAATGVNEGGSINETTLTYLDVSNKSISNLTGLGLLTGLTYLDISDNTTLTTGANITGLTALTTLKASNCNLISLAGTTGTSSVTGVTGPGLVISSNNVNITHLDLSYNANFYSSSNLQHLTKLETLIMNNCTHFDFWGIPGNYMSSLKYVDVSYCTDMDRIYLQAADKLEVLKAVGLTKLKGFRSKSTLSSSVQYRIVLSHNLTTVKCLDVSGCSQLSNIYLRYCTSLQHLNAAGTKVTGFSAYAGLNDGDPTDGYIQLANNLATLDYLNLANCSSLTSFRAIKDTYNIACLDTLILTNDTHLGWSNDGIEAQTAMTYLDVTNCGISTTGSYVPNFDNLTALETLLYGENPNVGYLRLTGNSNLKTLDLHGNTGLTMLALDNCGLPRTNLSIDDTNCPALTGLKLNNNGYGSVGQAMDNATAWGLDNVRFLYLENNSGFNGNELILTASDCAGLTGLDLGNNGFTSFKANELPETLTALMLGKNTSMNRLEMHYNPGITTMAADTVMHDGSGLYLLGNSALTYMDISGTAERPNHFQRIGNNGSLNGVPIDTLKASYNKFYTFRNLSPVAGDNYERWSKTTAQYDNIVSSTPPSLDSYYYAYWPASPAQTDSASLEQLTTLKYLDLSHCQLKDSLYLHKNTELRYLDVSHNRTIARYTTSHDKGAAYRASIPSNSTFNRDFPDYKKYLWLTTNHDDREYFTSDYNDTTGLYILDLMDNDKLEYLDISYTGIEQTALTHCHVSNARYIWIQDLNNLKYFYADFNGMRSMGIGTLYGKKNREGLKSLERLSVIGMRGADNRTMQGSINFRENSVCTHLHYVNLSYSRFDSIGVYAPQIDTLIIVGNPLHYVDVQKVNDITYIDARKCAYKTRGYDVETGNIFYPDANVYKNGARVGGTYNGAVTTPLSGLRGIRAFNRPKLTTVLLDSCNALTDVYCHHDPMLPKIDGFDKLAFNKSYDSQYGFPTVDADSLTLVWVNDNAIFNELNLSHNDNLKYLHAYNDKSLGTALDVGGLDLTANKNLITAWVSNSLLQAFTNGAKENLDTLKIWQNPQLDHLDVSKNTGLKWFDLRNCMIRSLDMSKNTQLTYFDCSNLDSISAGWNTFNNYGFEMPAQVPTSMNQPGKNSIADLHFNRNALQVVRADNNDLYCMDGLNDNASLHTLTYSYNHINAIDLSGCPSITEYNCYHNVRGLIMGELATWKERGPDNEVLDCSMYYLQLEEDAGDALQENYDTFLGHKCGQDTIEPISSASYMRQLRADGFDPQKVISFTVNSAGPYIGTRGRSNNAPRRTAVVYGPDDAVIDPSNIYGTIAVIKMYDPYRNYIEYIYDDGRPSTSLRSGGGSGFGIAWAPPGEPTQIEDVVGDDLMAPTVISERYFDISGKEYKEPVSGVNIIVRQMSDGTTQRVKLIR